MKVEPLISVIVPVYNGAAYIALCFQSILAQTYKNFELIIINDGSQDNSKEICDYYASQDNRVKVFHQENHGLSAVRNRGIKEANGEYIGFVDSDDCIHPDMYKVLMINLLKTNAGISMCNFKKVFDRNIENNEYDESELDQQKVSLISQQEAFGHLFDEMNVSFVVPWNKLYKKEIFQRVQYPNGKVHDDEFTVHKIIQATDKIAFTEKALYYYYNNPVSFMNETYNLKRLDAVTALRERFIFFVDNEYILFQSKEFNTYMHHLIIHYNLLKKFLPEERSTLKKLVHTFREDFKKHRNIISRKKKAELMLFYVHPNVFKKYISNKKRLYNLKVNIF